MKNRRISVQISKTINIGNYESLKFQAGIEADIKDDAELSNEYKFLWDTAGTELAIKQEEFFGKKEIVNQSVSSRIANRKPKLRR